VSHRVSWDLDSETSLRSNRATPPSAGERERGGTPWSPAVLGKLVTPPIMWYDEAAKQTVGYWISPKPLDIKVVAPLAPPCSLHTVH
jgi:hypothetical protein